MDSLFREGESLTHSKRRAWGKKKRELDVESTLNGCASRKRWRLKIHDEHCEGRRY